MKLQVFFMSRNEKEEEEQAVDYQRSFVATNVKTRPRYFLLIIHEGGFVNFQKCLTRHAPGETNRQNQATKSDDAQNHAVLPAASDIFQHSSE